MGGFEQAHAAIDAHDVAGLRALLDRDPALASATGGANANTLLGMAAATCDERLVELVLDAGADPDQPNVHGWTALHQAGYANATHLVPMLLAAGADASLSARGDGGTPFVVAAFWGNTATMALLPVLPRNLRAAAATGDLSLSEDDGAHRAYYRPHSGFPEWAPSGDRQEVLDEALCWAARCDRAGVLAELVDRGAHLEADVYRGTALTWAAATGAVAAMRELLRLGADVDGRSLFGGETHGHQVTPLHIAGQSGQAEAVRVLLEAGAATDVVDGHGYGTPAGWAEHGGHPEIAMMIRDRG